MELIRDLHNIRERHKDCVATIGNFDGIHLGHQAIIAQLKAAADEYKLPTVVLTFEPQPQEFFRPEHAPARLMRMREKIEGLDKEGIDRLVCLRFNASLASLSAETFVKEILVEGIAVRHLVVGDDFRFGKDRLGDFSLLQRLGKQNGFDVIGTVTQEINGRRISSTWVRDLLASGELEYVQQLLGRPYFMSGRIIHGDKRGRALGYPTINIDLHRMYSPVSGIFVSLVSGLGDEKIQAVTSIGTRPMFDGEKMVLEAHLLDFNESVYGRYVQVELLKQLRDESVFDDIEQLKQQIQRDVENTREFFKCTTNN